MTSRKFHQIKASIREVGLTEPSPSHQHRLSASAASLPHPTNRPAQGVLPPLPSREMPAAKRNQVRKASWEEGTTEAASIFHRLGIDTLEVLEAAGSKSWIATDLRPSR